MIVSNSDFVNRSPNNRTDELRSAALTHTDADTQRFLSILQAGSTHLFLQNITGNKRLTKWFCADEPLLVPSDWLKDGNVYFGVHGTTVRITEKDRKKEWAVGKADSYIEKYVASKNETIAASNTLYAEFDGKDFTEPTQAEIDAQFASLRADPSKAKASDKALHNEAVGLAKSAKYLTNPEHYKALASAHVAKLTPTPSVIVASGGGWQCYWLLAETFYLRTDADRQRARDTQERWVMFVGGDPGAKDLRRILRLPGTYNHKKAYAPNYPLVSFVKKDFDLRYTLDALEAYLPTPEAAEATRKPQAAQKAHTDASEPAALDLASLQAKGDSIVSLFNASVKIRNLLLLYGYSDQGERMSRPGEPESRGVEIDEATNRSRHWSSNDPLFDPHWQTPFGIWCKMEFGDNFRKARQALIDAIFPDLSLWARTTSFEEHVYYESEHYRGDSKDTPVFDSMLDIYEKTGTFGATVGKRIGARNAGINVNTFMRSLLRMHNFFEVTQSIADHKFYVRLKWENVVLSKQITSSLLKIVGNRLSDPFSANDKITPIVNEYSPRKADEPFLTGTSKVMRERFESIALAFDITVKQAKLCPVYNEATGKEELTFVGLGESSLRVIDAMIRDGGDMTAQELADETGKKLSAIRTALRKLEQHEIVEAERDGPRGPKIYSLAPDVWGKVSELAPSLRTYGLVSRRENDRLEAAQKWAKDGIDEAEAANNQEQSKKLQGRFAKLAKERMPHLQRLHPDLSMKEIERLAYEVDGYKRGPSKEVRAHRRAQRLEHAETVRMIRELAESYMDIDTPQEEIYSHIMQFGTFAGDMVKSVLQSPKQMQNYETLADIRKRLAWNEHVGFIQQMSKAKGIVSCA